MGYEVERLYKTERFEETYGTIKLEQWPEGIVLWFGGEIVWRSWKDKPQDITLRLRIKTEFVIEDNDA